MPWRALSSDVSITTVFEFDESADVLTMVVEHAGDPVIDNLSGLSGKIIGGIRDIRMVEKRI